MSRKVTLMLDREFEMLKKYMGGRILSPEDKEFIESNRSCGFDDTGITVTSEGLQQIVNVTDHGKERYNQERIYRSPIRDFFYTVAALLLE